MSKKQKRKVSQTTVAPAANQANTPVMVATPPPAPVVRRSSVTYSSEFNPDYTPVIKDLKRIGILAGSFLTILVILSFFLN